MSFDVNAIRKQFPILRRTVHGKPLVYLDSAASAQKPEAVIEAMTAAMRGSYANVHRGLHTLANETTQAYENARESVRRLLNAGSVDEIVFTKGGTESINIVAAGIGQSIKPGDEIVLSVMEHHSNIVPWNFLRERRGAVLKWVELLPDGSLDMDSLEKQLSKKTRILALTHMSNVLGTVPDVKRSIGMAHAVGADVLLDGCQAVVNLPVDVQALDADYYAFTGHKLYGPTGIGVLYGKKSKLEALPPFEGGGEMIETVTREAITYNAPPHRFEAGTPPILEAIGLGAAIQWLEALDRAAIREHKDDLLHRAVSKLRGINGLTIHGTAEGKGPVLTFSLQGAHPHDIAQILDRQGVAIRAGHHCAQPLMSHLRVTATARASFALYNTAEEVDAFVEALSKA
ncbi:MAG TPA: cysteine desulfurase, partial [Hyphomonadaceae bacterium]|nr:cysteine desulfurase [Hyphomonadaceae bacterium]